MGDGTERQMVAQGQTREPHLVRDSGAAEPGRLWAQAEVGRAAPYRELPVQ